MKQELNLLVPMYEELAHAAKVHLLQSIVSRILLDMIFTAYFVGLSSEQAAQFIQMEQLLGSYGMESICGVHVYSIYKLIKDMSGSPEAVNQWRATTLGLLRKEAGQKMQTETTAVTEAVIKRINRVLNSITDTKASEARDQGLRVLVNNSIELSRLLVVQKAVFRMTMPEILPHQKIIFDPTTMEDVGGEDEEGLAQREICCVTFPGIIKSGDENGRHLQYRNAIAKARVLCSPE
jgi:activating signal cointegrator complex subunit 1